MPQGQYQTHIIKLLTNLISERKNLEECFFGFNHNETKMKSGQKQTSWYSYI